MTKTGLPAASGAIPRTVATKCSSVALSLPSPFGATSSRFSPSAETQRWVDDWGNISIVTCSAMSRLLNLTQGRHQRRHENALGVVPGRLGLLCQCCQGACETACLSGGRGWCRT